MIEFHYVGRSREGAPQKGVVRAANVDGARLLLMGQGISPVEIKADGGGHSLKTGAPTQALSRADILFFTRELTHLKQAKVPLDKALLTLKEIAATDALKRFVQAIEEGIRGGKSLHQTLQPHESALGKRYIALVRAGEASGALTEILGELLEQMEADEKLRNHLISALTYPAILLGVAICSVVILLVFVVPQFRQIFDSMGDGLPYLTRSILNISDFIRQHWVLLFGALAGGVVLFQKWRLTPSGREAWDGFILKIPFLGLVVKNLQLSMYFRTLGTLIHRRVPLIDSLQISSEVFTNAALRASVNPIAPLIKGGGRLSAGFGSEWFRASTVPQLIRVAEETGRLDATLLGLANRFEDEGRRTLARTLAAVEPLIIVLLGMLVAVIIVAILSGVLSINDTI